MGVLKSVEPTGFLAFAPAFAGTNWADVNRRIIQNCPHGRGRVLSSPSCLVSGFAGLGQFSFQLLEIAPEQGFASILPVFSHVRADSRHDYATAPTRWAFCRREA